MSISKVSIVLGTCFLLISCSSGFSDAEISEVKRTIESKYVNRGAISADAKLVRDSDYRLTGLVQFRYADSSRHTHTCSATMDKKDRSWIWQCKP
jgi:uncharacterized membrane protein